MKLIHYAAAAAASLLLLSGCAGAPETKDLFNGTDLTGWNLCVEGDGIPATDVFKVENGEIHISGVPFGYMYTDGVYKNYELDVEWSWFDEPMNSGIFLIVNDLTVPFPKTVECQLHGGDAGDFVLLGGAMLKEYQIPEEGLPQFPKMVKKEASSENPVGEWNHAHIIVVDGHITVYVNDVLQNEGTNEVKEGRIALQSEGGPIRFRSVKIKELD
ncbi:MAG: DUF1080 domain-containing protein [Bacteroidales bacterium]|nr:DUF1080 domain-containing protein [Bacteroidales bacterium]